jgi:integrase
MKSEGTMTKRGKLWQTRKTVKGRKLQWSTKTGEKNLALQRARDHWAKVLAGEYAMVDRQRSRSDAPTLAELKAAYLDGWMTDKPARSSRRQNWGCLERLVRLGEGCEAVDGLRVNRISGETVRRYQRAKLAAAGEDPEARQRVMFSANSELTQARAVFKHEEPWRLAELEVPDLEDFLEAPRFTGVAIASEFRPFSDAELAALRAALEAAKVARPALWMAAALMLWGGLRNSEVRRARAGWVQQKPPCIQVAVSKTAKGVRAVPLPAEVAEQLGKLAGPDALLPGKNDTERRRLVERDLNEWLDGVLPGRSAYDLRRQSGSLVLDQQGEIAARDWLGHRSADTTRRWYASRIRGLEPLRV